MKRGSSCPCAWCHSAKNAAIFHRLSSALRTPPQRVRGYPRAAGQVETMSSKKPTVDAKLEKLPHESFYYFCMTNPANGLVIDKIEMAWAASTAPPASRWHPSRWWSSADLCRSSHSRIAHCRIVAIKRALRSEPSRRRCLPFENPLESHSDQGAQHWTDDVDPSRMEVTAH